MCIETQSYYLFATQLIQLNIYSNKYREGILGTFPVMVECGFSLQSIRVRRLRSYLVR